MVDSLLGSGASSLDEEKHTIHTLQVCIVLLGAYILCAPTQSHAAVIISEVAWMGGTVSANDEWIELHNRGNEAVSLEGWTLSDGMNLSISLSGTINPDQYALLERTDDSSAPGTAFLIYTGALPNTGATLTLSRTDQGVEDQVAGGENWQAVGGDNTMKETPQFSAQGWITAAPTPGAANATTGTIGEDLEDEEEEGNEEEESEEGPERKKSGVPGSNETISLILPDVTLTYAIEAPKTAHVNQPLVFKAVAQGISEQLANSVVIEWNFGDTHLTSGREVTHAYAYPGDYTIVTYGGYGRHRAARYSRITVVPVQISLARADSGEIQINNDAPYEVDLSGYTMRDGASSFTVPSNTIIQPRATITLPADVFSTGALTVNYLYDASGVVVADTNQKRTIVVASAAAVSTPPVALVPSEEFSFQSEVLPFLALPAEAAEPELEPEPVPKVMLSASANESETIPRATLPYLGFIGVLVIATAALYVGKRGSV